MFFVLEGPDGAGKTSAIKRINREYPEVRLMPRAASSENGPTEPLDDYADRTVSILHGADWSGDAMFDRHCLISELVYGPLIRGTLPGRFNDPVWLRMRTKELANRAMVVWCLPPWREVEVNVLGTDSVQMPGVRANIRSIYSAYEAMRALWPGYRQYTHDYTQDRTGDHLMRAISHHLGKS